MKSSYEVERGKQNTAMGKSGEIILTHPGRRRNRNYAPKGVAYLFDKE